MNSSGFLLITQYVPGTINDWLVFGLAMSDGANNLFFQASSVLKPSVCCNEYNIGEKSSLLYCIVLI